MSLRVTVNLFIVVDQSNQHVCWVNKQLDTLSLYSVLFHYFLLHLELGVPALHESYSMMRENCGKTFVQCEVSVMVKNCSAMGCTTVCKKGSGISFQPAKTKAIRRENWMPTKYS